MKLSRVIMALVLLGILGMSAHFAIDTDTWWHLKAGEWMVENGRIIQEDPFSYTKGGTPWQYPGVWLQVGMYLLYDWFGPGALNIWTAVMVTAIFYPVLRMSRGNVIFVAFVVLLAVIASAIYWNARPYLVSFLLFAFIYFILDRYYRRGKGKLWLLPVLMVVWVNTHGSFLAGFILTGPFFVDALMQSWIARNHEDAVFRREEKEKALHILIVFGLMLVASLITPHGWNIWALPFTTFTRQAEQQLITEWQSPNFHDTSMLPFAALLLLSLAVLGGANKRLRLFEILLLAGFGNLGLVSMRNIMFFSIVAPPILTRYGDRVIANLGEDIGISLSLDFDRAPGRIAGRINALIVIVVGLLVVFSMVRYLPVSANQEDFTERFPVAAVEFLKEASLDGRIFNSYNYGGYLIWALEEYPVYIDGRADLYGDEVILPYYEILTGSEDWQAEFDRWDIKIALVEPQVDLVDNLEMAGWERVFEDEISVVLYAPDG